MKVLMVAPFVPLPANDGGRAALLSLVRSLRREGIDIHFVAPRAKAGNAELFAREVVLHLVDYDPRSTLIGRFRSLFSALPYSAEKFFSMAALYQIEEIVEREHCEIIHAETVYLARFAMALKERYHLPVVIREQNVESEILRSFRDRVANPAVRLYAHYEYVKTVRFETAMVGKCDAVIPITEEDAGKLRTLASPRRSVVVPVGIDTGRLLFGHTFVPDRLLFFTNFDWPPNRESFDFYRRDIHGRLLARRPSVRTVVAGKGLDKIAATGLPPSMDLRGFVDDLNDVSALASIAIVPLRVGSGIRVKILELMAMGVVVVTTSLGAGGIAARHGEHLIIADEPDMLAEWVDKLLDDPSELRRMAEAARRLVVEHYSALAFGGIAAEVYASLVREHRSGSTQLPERVY